ncbi:MAG: UPF0158 family protein [Bacteroidota bacterium]
MLVNNIPNKYKKVISEIADNLIAGFVCFLNPNTLEFEYIPETFLNDPEEYELMTGETWEREEKLHENWEKSIEIAPMDSFEAFRIMEDFAEQLNDRHMQKKLISTLNNRKPFANFKLLVEGSEYREQWFVFRQQANENYVWDLIATELGENY